MSVTETRQTVMAYHEGWTSRNFDQARAQLSSRLQTEVPINEYHSVDEWMQAVERTASMAQNVTLLAEFANDEDALLLYDLELPAPIGTLRVAEHFTVRDGKIHHIQHVHDTSALRAALSTSAGPHGPAR